jgi:hypothetical protein
VSAGRCEDAWGDLDGHGYGDGGGGLVGADQDGATSRSDVSGCWVFKECISIILGKKVEEED